MTSSQKFSVSLLISVVAFAFFAVLSLSGQFDFIEAKFYQPAVRRPVEQKVSELAETEKQYNQILFERFADFCADEAVLSFTKSQPDDEQVRERTEVCARLFASSPYLLGIRIVDGNGRKIHFSTFASDKKKQDDRKVVYEDYSGGADGGEVDFSLLKCAEGQKFKIYNDGAKKRVIFSLPFTGKDNSDRIDQNSLALFYCEAEDFLRFAYSKNLLSISQKDGAEYLFTGLSSAGGYVFGLPRANMDFSVSALESLKTALAQKIKAALEDRQKGGFSPAAIAESSGIIEETFSMNASYSILDKETDEQKKIESEAEEFSTQGQNAQTLTSGYEFVLFTKIVELGDNSFGFVSFVCNGEDFKVSASLRILLLSLVFVTLFLIIFLIFNLKRDDMAVIKDKIHKFQVAFIDGYAKSRTENSKNIDEELKKRRGELEREIKKSLGRRGKKHGKEIEELFGQTWKEILTAVGGKADVDLNETKENTTAKIDSSELKSVLEEILGSGKINLKVENGAQSAIKQPVPPVEKTEEIDDIEPVEDAEPVEEVEDIEPIETLEEIEKAEPVDDVEPLEEVEEAEPVEDIEPIEDLEEVEPIEDSEPLEEVEEAESVDDVEPVDELEEVEPVEDVEPAEEIDDAEPVDEIEEVEPLEEVVDAEEVDELEEVESIEDVTDAEPVDELEEVENVEAVDDLEEGEDVEPIEDLEEVEPIEDSEPVEDVEEAENVEDAEPVDDLEEVEEAESVDELEEVEPAEAVEELEDVEDVEPLEEVADDETSSDGNGVISEPAVETTDVDLAEFIDEEPALPESQSDSDPQTETTDVALSDFFDEEENAPAAETTELPAAQMPEDFLEEEIGFGVPEQQNGSKIEDENSGINDDFKVEAMDFSFLDNEDFSEKSDDVQQSESTAEIAGDIQPVAEVSDSTGDIDVISEPEPLEPVETASTLESLSGPSANQPFMFAKFGANNNHVTELTPLNSQAIVETEDGTFQIQGKPEMSDIVLDQNLAELVESVLK